jgi:4'-phosphopantetheinyl transferase EntD
MLSGQSIANAHAVDSVASSALDSEKICSGLRAMLPAGVCVAAGAAIAMPLSASEHLSLGPADAERVREFVSGRAYAKRALAMLGMDNVDLPIGPNRAPVWPKGVVGSITHVLDSRRGTYAAAAVGRADAVLGVGIDLEVEGSVHPHLWRYILTEQELERILSLPLAARLTEAQHIWGAKEAAAKVVKQPFNPSEIEIQRDQASGDFTANFFDNNRLYLQSRLRGRTARLDSLFMATAILPRQQENFS